MVSKLSCWYKTKKILECNTPYHSLNTIYKKNIQIFRDISYFTEVLFGNDIDQPRALTGGEECLRQGATIASYENRTCLYIMTYLLDESTAMSVKVSVPT